MKNPYLRQKWTARTALGRARSVLLNQGPRSLFYKVAGELVYRRLMFDGLRFDDVRTETFGDHELVKLERGDFAEYLQFRTDLNESEIDERLQRGHECHAIIIDGEVAQSSWVAAGNSAEVAYLGCEIELGAEDIYVYEFVVHPSHRGRKLFPAALSRLVAEYRGRGFKRIIWGYLPENARAVEVAQPWPFRPLGTLGYWQIAGWRKYFRSMPAANGAPRLVSERLVSTLR